MEIELTQGYRAQVDDADYERLSQRRWCALVHRRKDSIWVYAISGTYPDILLMHREVMSAPTDYEVDHKDGNGLNNTRDNLRLCTHAQNMCNRKPQSGGASKYKGVHFYPRRNKWGAEIKLNKKRIWLGRFNNELDAAHAYDAKARELHGEFARLNFQ